MSDHLPIFGIMKLSKPNRNLDLQNSYKRFFTERNKDKFVHCLGENLVNIDYNLDPNSIMDDVLLATKKAIDTVFPLKKVSRKQSKLMINPWMTNDILKEQDTRDKLKMKFILLDTTPSLV